MRAHKLTLCAFAAIAALATACSNDELASTDTPKEGIVIEATANAPQEGADTRVTHTDGTTSMNIVWATGDSFTAYASASNKTSYTIASEDAGKGSASFTGTWGTEPSGVVYAIYPSQTATDHTAITLSLTGQNGTLSSLKDYNYMTSSTTYVSGESLSFSFAHRVAIVKLVLTFPDGVTGDASNVGLKATGLNKSATLNLTTGIFSSPQAGDITANGTIAITNKQLTAYLCVFPGSLTGAKAIATVGSDTYEADLADLPIVKGNMYTATVTMAKKEAGITWAPGNLVADGNGGCINGTATDGGLYFQFGSLVGWSGGATGDGTGTAVDGLPLAVKVTPNGYTAAPWDELWTGDPAEKDASTGKGDPCHYYLGGTWRLPTKDEYVALFNDNGYPSTGPWTWENSSATHTNGLTFPASGCRYNNDGSLGNVGTNGYCWSSSPSDVGKGYYLYFDSYDVLPSSNYYRAYGYPVRCVQASN